VDFSGDKISLYFCLCSSDAIDQGGACAGCLSNHYCLQPPLSIDTYSNVCNGNADLGSILEGTTSCC
jgi:hypothetical protein